VVKLVCAMPLYSYMSEMNALLEFLLVIGYRVGDVLDLDID
jgi:hypothetical protein